MQMGPGDPSFRTSKHTTHSCLSPSPHTEHPLTTPKRIWLLMAQSLPHKEAILAVALIGFHHSKGSLLEFTHPETGDLTPFKHLIHQALPDGAHNVGAGSVCFVVQPIPSGEDDSPPSNCLVVSCFRQISTEELDTAGKEEFTRTTVQKAVCVVSKMPTYGLIEARLRMVTEAYFEGKNFSDKSLLIDLYDYLVKAASRDAPVGEIVHLGLDLKSLLTPHQHRPLQIVKALLLGSSVMVYSPSAEIASRSVLSLASLIPSCVEGMLNRDHSSTFMNSAESGWIQPYICLQQMKDVAEKFSGRKLHLFGAANPLFERRHPDLCDVFFNVKSGQLIVNAGSLKSSLKPTLADLRFCTLLQPDTSVEGNTSAPQGTGWTGSDDYIRTQFRIYLSALVSADQSNAEEHLRDFGSEFIAMWRETAMYSQLLPTPELAVGTCLSGAERLVTHPCHGAVSLSDVRRKLVAQMSDYVTTEQLEGVKQAVEGTKDRLLKSWNFASTAVWSWWGDQGQEEESSIQKM